MINRKYIKDMTLDLAKKELKEVTSMIKEFKKENKLSNRMSNLDSLRNLFRKYHKMRFVINKVRYIKGKKHFGDAKLFMDLMFREAWLKGFIVAKLYDAKTGKKEEVKK